MQPISPLEAVRRTPEVIVWALAIFVCGVAILPLLHLAAHDHEHTHGALHAAGIAHDHPATHGEGDGLHFGLAWLEGEVPSLALPVGEMALADPARPGAAPALRSVLTPIRPGAP